MQPQRTKLHISEGEFQQIFVSDIVYFVSHASEHSPDPDFEWHGKVIAMHHDSDFVKVMLMTEGYEGEIVRTEFMQIVRWEPGYIFWERYLSQ
jgi:hypothetical protein